MVEQMSAAAESLQEQAQHLLDAVAVFKLPHNAQQEARQVIHASRVSAAKATPPAPKKAIHLVHNKAAAARTEPSLASAGSKPASKSKLPSDDGDWDEF
jgi:methyl-accepting chemotaxis protein